MHHGKAQYVIFKIEKFLISNLTSFRFDMMHNTNFDQWQVLYFMGEFWYSTFKIKKLYVFDLRHNKESLIFSKIWRFLIFDFHNEDSFIFDMMHTFKNLIFDNFLRFPQGKYRNLGIWHLKYSFLYLTWHIRFNTDSGNLKRKMRKWQCAIWKCLKGIWIFDLPNIGNSIFYIIENMEIF